jgi:hypothetical protein
MTTQQFSGEEVRMPTLEIDRIQSVLDVAFADFKAQNPELAEALETLNISYSEYLRVLSGLNAEPQTASGNAINL